MTLSAAVGVRRRVEVLGVRIDEVNLTTAVRRIADWIASRDRQYVCVTGVHGIMESQRDAGLRAIHNASGMTTPDGMPMVWCGRYAGSQVIERVYGPDLMEMACEAGAKRSWSMFFYGGGDGVADLLAERLRERFPGIVIAGTLCPPFRPLTPKEVEATNRAINDSRPDIVWVGLSTPKQERWLAEHREQLTAPVLIGVGAAFDIHAGLLRQAPPWMQRHGLEWAFRLAVEPRRLWRRYLRNNPVFVWRIARRPPRLLDSA